MGTKSFYRYVSAAMLALLVYGTVLIVACDTPNASSVGVVNGAGVYKIHDDSAHVTCWVQYRGGMSCLRDEQ